MLRDAREPSNDELIETDLCIVGSGPAGISIARELRGSGYQICLLESGGRQPERRAQQLNRCQSTGYPIQLSLSRVRAFGGTSRWWWPDQTWASRPLDPIDFEARPSVRYSGWPFDRAHLEPFYERAHTVNDLGPYDYDPRGWTTACTPELPLAGPEIEFDDVPARARDLRQPLRRAGPLGRRDPLAPRERHRPRPQRRLPMHRARRGAA